LIARTQVYHPNHRRLAGLADRVAALGRALVVESPPGGGTVVRAVLPARRPEGVT